MSTRLSRHLNSYSTLTTTLEQIRVVLLKTGAGGKVSPSSNSHRFGVLLSCVLSLNNDELLTESSDGGLALETYWVTSAQ